MENIEVMLPDGSKINYKNGITVKEVAFDIGERLGRDAVAGEINGEKVKLHFTVYNGCFDNYVGTAVFFVSKNRHFV